MIVLLYPHPHPNSGGRKYYYSYSATLDGEEIVSNSDDPEFDIARALALRGVSDWVTIRDGRTGKSRTRVNVPVAKHLCTKENNKDFRFAKWLPFDRSKVRP